MKQTSKVTKNLLIDTHAHLDFDQYHREHRDVIKHAKEIGVFKIINVGSSVDGSIHSIDLATKYDEIYASCGLHPHDGGETAGEDIKRILELAKNPKVVAIGEIGLDYKDVKDEEIKITQQQLFKSQLSIAIQLGLPVIIHCREAFQDIYEILKLYQGKIKGVFHCFSEGPKEARKVIDLGFLISFTGNITYPKTDKIKKAVEILPLEKIMVETDSPFLAPQSERGKVNEPAYVIEVAKEIARIKNIGLVEVAKATTANAERLFKI